MSATGIATSTMRDALATAYGTAGPYLTLLKALTLQSATSSGATTFSVDLAVAAGDLIVFDQGQASQETVTVGSVSGSGPYTVTPVAALGQAHVLTGANGGLQSHIPATATTVHEVASITRANASWGDPDDGAITTAASAVDVTSGSKVGSIAVMSASTSGDYLDATAVPGQAFAADGTYVPVFIYTQS